jgi:mono/diheme cytochrome c family protein
METPFGVFYSPNLTPDRKTGLGGWTDSDFSAALRHGRSPDGSPYYPVFPYPAYAGMNDADVAAIAAWLRSIPPVDNPVPAHELPWYLRSRWVMLGWNLLFFDPQPFQADSDPGCRLEPRCLPGPSFGSLRGMPHTTQSCSAHAMMRLNWRATRRT